MRNDHKVEFRREETIERFAIKLRSLAKILENQLSFDICQFVLGPLKQVLKQMNKGELLVEVKDEVEMNGRLAYVTHKPLALCVKRSTWEGAANNDPFSRFVIAHEIGHLVMHDHYAQSFSQAPELRNRYAEEEYSAEWQADKFAHYFLLPVNVISIFPNEDYLLEHAHVPEQTIVHQMNSRRERHSGEACVECANFTLYRTGNSLRCDTCGYCSQIP